MKKLIVQLVTWNGATYIPFLFDSLRKQTYTDFKLIILDNASDDETTARIEHELASVPFEYEFKQQSYNAGFAGGHNSIYKEYESEFFLLLNQDMYLMPTCFQDMMVYMAEHTSVAAVSPRLMRWDFDTLTTAHAVDTIQASFTDDIDALGLKVLRSRRVIEWMTKQKWSNVAKSFQYQAIEVFGVSGAFPMFRREIIKHIAFRDGTFLDESYDSYKEDVDLAFRLRSAGYKAVILRDTVAYHDRSGAGPKELTDVAAQKNKLAQSSQLKRNSYKNHIATLIKNEYMVNILLDFPVIFWYELKKCIWFILFDRSILTGLQELRWKELLDKRHEIKEKRCISAKKLRVWWM